MTTLPIREVGTPDNGHQFSKPNKAILVCQIGGGLGEIDHKVFNCLFHYAAKDREAPNGPVKFQARAADFRVDIGLGSGSTNNQICRSLERLCRQPVIFPLIRCEDTGEPMLGTLVEDFRMEKGSGVIEWSMAPDLRPKSDRRKPNQEREFWTDIDMRIIGRLKGKYAPRLYEMMRMLAGRKEPVKNFPLAELRWWLGADRFGGDSLPTWHDFQKRALAPAIEQVNRVTDLSLKVKVFSDRTSRGVSSLTFTAEKKLSSE